MSLPRAFHSRIRAVQVRCGVNLLLRQAGRVLVVAGVIAALAVLGERLLALEVLTPWAVWSFLGMAAVAVLVLWFFVLPNRMQASLLLDERLGLSERVSTTLALAASDDPFARAARAESLSVVQHSNLAGHFPIKLSRSWVYGAGTWAATIAMVFLLPQRDLLGFHKEREQEQKKAQEAQLAQAEVKRVAEKVKDAVRATEDPNLVADLKKLDELIESSQPEVKREAIKALGDLTEKIKQMQASSKLNAADILQQTFKQLRGSANPFSQELRMALAKGNYAQAAGMLAQLQSQLNDGSLPEEKRRELAARMQELAKELQKLSEQKRQMEEELARLGLDKQLAQATPEQLRQALQQKGLSPEMVNQLMQKIEAGQAASASCASLGQALAGMGGANGQLSAGDLSGAIDELNALDALQQQAYMLEVSMAEISDLMAGLGQGMGKGERWEVGRGGGYGGKGIGLDPVDDHIITSNELTANKKMKVPSRTDQSPTVASWYFKDAQVKGEAQRSFVEVVQAGRASAAEALSENQIPRRYEDAVKTYFNQLEESGPKL